MNLRNAVALECPLQIAGTINAYTALLAKNAGFKAIYLSGAGVANASFGIPDIGLTTLNNVLEDTRRITGAVDLPLLVDIDTGWDDISHSVKELIKAGAAGVHIEDQVFDKRCGQLANKEIVSTNEMVNRIKKAIDAKTNSDFVVMARTDALQKEGLDATLERISRYVEAGADMIFFEGVQELNQYQALTKICAVPVLANITEFGLTPLFTVEELKQVGIQLVLYPLSAFRAMSKAALMTYETIKTTGTQKSLLDTMQTRKELYSILNYHPENQGKTK